MESTTATPYKLLKKIKDPKFSIDRLHLYNLSLHFGPRDLQVLITDTEHNRCVLLEDFIFDEQPDFSSRLGVVKELFDNHHLLRAGFWKSVTVCFKNNKFALVPADVYSEEHNSEYIRMNASYDAGSEVLKSFLHKSSRLVVVFAIEKGWIPFLESMYQNTTVRYMHQSSSLIEATPQVNPESQVFVVYVDRFYMHVCSTNKGKLVYYNYFRIKKFDDYQRYIRLASKILKIDTIHHPVTVYGFLGKNSPHVQSLKKFLPLLSFGGRTKQLKFGYVFDEVSDHQYLDLFALGYTKS